METTMNKGTAIYFRGCISEDDSRYCVMGAVINGKNDELGRKIALLNISLDGEIIIDYNKKRDDCPAEEVNHLYDSFFDGTLWDKPTK